MLGLAWSAVFCFGLVSLVTFILPLLRQLFYKEQNFKAKYGGDGSWALVTGASSGIGLAFSQKLAAQGINVVMVALDDEHFQRSFSAIQKDFPKIKFRRVPTNLGVPGYVSEITKATEDLKVRMVFCNAGYLLPGFFTGPDASSDRQLANLECNLVSAVKISHHFIGRMLSMEPLPGGRRGLVEFTSSSAAFLPNPLAVLYASTKAFMTNFAAGLAGEYQGMGIDILAVHPSPIASRFASDTDMLGPVKASMRIAAAPSVIADDVFASAGRCVIRDQGAVTLLLKLLCKAIDFNLLAQMFTTFSAMSPEFKARRSKLFEKRE
mmetsp:Transcript_33841/g.79240  ORF Transcript_33841/g.79240 Transcript_33841/m.79240 type:complete len:322 (+) Transcript_33841:3-968(+)